MARKIRKFKAKYIITQNIFTNIKNNNEAASKVSFWVTYFLAKPGNFFKSFTSGELIELCLIAAAKEMYPEKMSLFKAISLSVGTVA